VCCSVVAVGCSVVAVGCSVVAVGCSVVVVGCNVVEAFQGGAGEVRGEERCGDVVEWGVAQQLGLANGGGLGCCCKFPRKRHRYSLSV